VAYWYQTEPHATFPSLPSASERTPRPWPRWVGSWQSQRLHAATGVPIIQVVWVVGRPAR